ncbi:hypothetical protein DM860_015427 [Cuscuta australis]|uniref:Uncharacterized protein n=1 Tax=Cuscuta australis TaxID=267555 RepID=A0A328EAQ8_9ASTE|nr:hypothetical protein DM860_015427 [Cuscuta australis]
MPRRSAPSSFQYPFFLSAEFFAQTGGNFLQILAFPTSSREICDFPRIYIPSTSRINRNGSTFHLHEGKSAN